MEDEGPRRGGDKVPCTSDTAIIGHSLDSQPAVSLLVDPISGLRLAAASLKGHGQPRVRIFIDSALPAHAVRCCVRVSCSTNFLLHEGMLVVCVRVRRFLTIAPPTLTPRLSFRERDESGPVAVL